MPVERAALGGGKRRSESRWNTHLRGHSTKGKSHPSKGLTRVERYANDPVGDAPLCACGCGQRTKWNPRRKKWGTYIFGHAKTSEKTKYAAWKLSARPIVKGEPAPLCLCGCGAPVTAHKHGAGHFWSDYLPSHSMRGRERAEHLKEEARQRMLVRNPMFDPAVAKRAARTRGLAASPTKLELRFSLWVKLHKLPISFRGTGKLWINRRNPDFRIVGQKKAIEITTVGIFNGGSVEQRDAAGYGLQAINHYSASGWQCLVVFCHQDHRRKLPESLLPVVQDFASPGSNWSGVWNYDRLIPSA